MMSRREIRKLYKTSYWHAVREHRLRLNPICQHCGRRPSSEIDHIQNARRHGFFIRPSELKRKTQALCPGCHRLKGRRVDMREARTQIKFF